MADIYSNNNPYLTEQAKKRLIKDIVNIHRSPLTDQGIYYQHDDSNMTKGYALIIGPENTPYQFGNYLFEFNFPYDYPIHPPKLVFKTYDKYNNTRFHPNLYMSGKVCLSILNTWYGEQWTSCQTIRSILLTLVSILDENPLLNEPGYVKDINSTRNIQYNELISYKNIEISIYDLIKNKNFLPQFNIFYTFMIHNFKENYDNIKKYIKDNMEKDNKLIHIQVYNMNQMIKYKEIDEKITELYNSLEK